MAGKTRKMVCHNCSTIFNRKPQNKDKQKCWKCGSERCTLVTSTEVPPPEPVIPIAPDPSGLKMPVASSGGGGAITPQMLLDQKSKLKSVPVTPVQLPGLKNSPIPQGVRLLAFQVRNSTVQTVEYEVVWRQRGSSDNRYAYCTKINRDLKFILTYIAEGRINPDHANFNDDYMNNGAELPIRKGPRDASVFTGIDYYEYGWKTPLGPGSKWFGYSNGLKSFYSNSDNAAVDSYIRNVKGGQIFSERLIFSETGEIFYTSDHYCSFFRYHPGTDAWYSYRSSGGSAGPDWDESFYEPATGVV